MSDHILIERPDSAPGVQIIRFNRLEKKNASQPDSVSLASDINLTTLVFELIHDAGMGIEGATQTFA